MSTNKKKGGLWVAPVVLALAAILVAPLFFVWLVEVSKEPYSASILAPVLTRAPVQYRVEGQPDWQEMPWAGAEDCAVQLTPGRYELRLRPGLAGVTLTAANPELFPQLGNYKIAVRRVTDAVVVSGIGYVYVYVAGSSVGGNVTFYSCKLELASE